MITGRWFPVGQPPREAAALWSSAFSNAAERTQLMSSSSRAACVWDDGGRLAAAGQMYYDDGAYWLNSVAVRSDLRGQGYGDLLTRMMVDMAVQHGARVIRLDTPRECVGFFERYGFQVINEDATGIRMEADAQSIRLTCGG